MSLTHFLAVFLGGGLGACARWGLSLLFAPDNTEKLGWPWGTFLANALGCLLIGGTFAYFGQNSQTPTEAKQLAKLLLLTGFLGGFTTFSSFSLETLQLWQKGQLGLALGYAAGSLVTGLLLTLLAHQLIRAILN